MNLIKTPFLADTTIIGAIVGGFISGSVALASVLYASMTETRFRSEDRLRLSEDKLKESNEKNEAELFSVFSKLTEILDDVTKAYRHQLDGDPRGFIHLQGGPRLRKPLSGVRQIIRFRDNERILPLRMKQAELFNVINQSERTSESLFFLQELYEKSFNLLQEKVLSQDSIEVEGQRIGGEVIIRKTDLLHIADLDQHLRKLLLGALPELRSGHSLVIEILEKEFGRKIDFREEPNVRGGVYSDGGGED